MYFKNIFLALASLRGSENVWLVDVTRSSQTKKQTLSDFDLPKDLTFHLRSDTEILTLRLRRNYNINPNVAFYFARNLEDGQLSLMKPKHLGNKICFEH
ncbi:hypothetical protein CHS0354_016516 [Potamilus streckersoni]|uniref:Uncharacterized protein n=1 Tax=Potamilus streckersoni TaxID=2493646 RepID=A0AAE0SIV5_9BIVA|nr:hypothetical protein CHS0354_016516 [Potamilus streckersoni]